VSTIPQDILVELLRAALATVVLIAWLWLLARVYPRLYAKLEHLRTTGAAKVRIQGLELLSSDRLALFALRIARLTRITLTVLAFYLYTPLVLSYFPWTAPYAEPVVQWAISPFATAWVSFVEYLPSIFWLAAIIIITRLALQLLGLLSNALRDGSITFDGFYPEWAEPTYKIVRVLVFAFALVMAFPYLPGSSSDAFKGVSIFLGVLQLPAPFVLQTNLGDYSVRYELNVHTKSPEKMLEIHSHLHAQIQDAFAGAGMEIMSPMYLARRDAPSTVPAILPEDPTPA